MGPFYEETGITGQQKQADSQGVAVVHLNKT